MLPVIIDWNSVSSHPRHLISFIIGDYLVKVPKIPTSICGKMSPKVAGLPLLKLHMSSMSQVWMARCAPSMSPNPGTTNCLDPGTVGCLGFSGLGWVLFLMFFGGLLQYVPTSCVPNNDKWSIAKIMDLQFGMDVYDTSLTYYLVIHMFSIPILISNGPTYLYPYMHMYTFVDCQSIIYICIYHMCNTCLNFMTATWGWQWVLCYVTIFAPYRKPNFFAIVLIRQWHQARQGSWLTRIRWTFPLTLAE